MKDAKISKKDLKKVLKKLKIKKPQMIVKIVNTVEMLGFSKKDTFFVLGYIRAHLDYKKFYEAVESDDYETVREIVKKAALELKNKGYKFEQEPLLLLEGSE